MRVKTLTTFIKPGGGTLPPGSIIDLDPEAYDRHQADGNVIAVEVAQAIEEGEAKIKAIREDAEAKVQDLVKAARERGAAEVSKAHGAVIDARKTKG